MSPTSLADIGCSPSGPHAAELRVRLVDDPRSMKHIASCQPRIFYESRSVNLGFAGLCSVASRVLSLVAKEALRGLDTLRAAKVKSAKVNSKAGKATKLPLPATALMPPPRPPAKDKKMALCRFKQSLYHDLRFALQMACGAKRLLNLVLGPGAQLAWYSKCEFIPCEIEAGQRGNPGSKMPLIRRVALWRIPGRG